MRTRFVLSGLIAALAITSIALSLYPDQSVSTLSEQERVDADLISRGYTIIDGVAVHPDNLASGEMTDDLGTMDFKFGGWIIAEHYDIDGNLLSKQVLHNRVVDEGEDFIIDQVFKEGQAGETADADQIATICVSAEVSFVDTSETKTAATFDSADNLTETNCISDTTVNQTGQTAVIGALTFTGGTHVANGDTITGIGICQGAAATPFANCADAQAASSGILLSQINIADVTLNAAETVDITYTLDLSSASS